jgi:hypothetical protein
MRKIRTGFLCTAALLLAQLAPGHSSAQQFSVMGGAVREHGWNDDAKSYALEYSAPLTKTFSYSVGYLNEGHVTDHHRDGIGAQLWAGLNLTNSWVVKAGVGPYVYFDTAAKPGNTYADDHGLGVIASVATSYQLTQRWGVELRANRVMTSRSVDLTSALVGVNYTFDAPGAATAKGSSSTWQSYSQKPNELAVLAGQTWVNNFESETATAFHVEYRRSLSRNFDWTAGVVREGAPGPLNRTGILSQLWAVRPFWNDRATIGIGLGPYLARDSKDDDRTRLSAGVSFTGSVMLTNNFLVRATWNRIATQYDRDTDVILIGAGLRW